MKMWPNLQIGLRRLRYFLLVAFIIIAVSYLAVLQEEIHGIKLRTNEDETLVILPGEFIGMFVFSGFRALAADILWLRADDFFHAGEWHRMYPVFRIITWLQPHFIENWCTGGWHLAYNLFYYARNDPEQQRMFLEEGIHFLKEGIVKNPKNFRLYEALAWTYRHKLNDFDNALKYFSAGTRVPHPSRLDRMVAHLYHLKGDREGEYRQWLYCLTVFTDEPEHMKLTRRFLTRVKYELGIE